MAVELRKGQKVNLEKHGTSVGEILINLNWRQPVKLAWCQLNCDCELSQEARILLSGFLMDMR